MARPKFSEEICACLVENYGNGLPLKYCADAVGIHRNTLLNWMKKGEGPSLLLIILVRFKIINRG